MYEMQPQTPAGTPPKSNTGKYVLFGCLGCLGVSVLGVGGLIGLGFALEEPEPTPPSFASPALTPEEAAAVGEQVGALGMDAIEAAVLPALREMKFPPLYLQPQIPHDKLEAAKIATVIPEDRKILGVLDATVLGSAEVAMIFAADGIYFRNDWSGKSPGPGFVAYTEFPGITFAEIESWEVGLGKNRSFNVSGLDQSSWAAPTLMRVRAALIEAARNTAGGPAQAETKTDLEAGDDASREHLGRE